MMSRRLMRWVLVTFTLFVIHMIMLFYFYQRKFLTSDSEEVKLAWTFVVPKSIQGTLIYDDGAPVAAAKITFYDDAAGQEFTTDENGYFAYRYVNAPENIQIQSGEGLFSVELHKATLAYANLLLSGKKGFWLLLVIPRREFAPPLQPF